MLEFDYRLQQQITNSRTKWNSMYVDINMTNISFKHQLGMNMEIFGMEYLNGILWIQNPPKQ
jgi:hypothetical protein